MSLAKEVQEIQAATAKRCRVAVVASELGDEGPELLALLDDPSVTLRSLITVLRRRGFAVSDKVLSKHRRGECECPR